jgi:transposase|tara:strand:+ start:223 stop:1443 length:1221 start_codon:yes stop_codon:yes gene_type:complete
MFTHQFFDLLLNLDDSWQVKTVDADYNLSEIKINIRYVGNQAECPDTLEHCSIYDHAPNRTWRHLDTMQYKTYISCGLPRVKNTEGKVVTIIPPWASKHERHTKLFEHAIIDLLLATKNQTKTAALMRCGFNVINRVIHLSTKRGLSRRDLSNLVIDHLSIDEKSFKKGHKYVSVLSLPKSGYILDVEQGRTKKSVRDLLDKSLTDSQQQKVQTISLDMWKAYLSVSKEKLPNAEIVHDRFHLVKYLNEAIDKVRRREVKTNEELKNSRYALLKNQENLTEKQRIKFDAIRMANYQVSKAWEVKENFRGMFNQESEKTKGFLLFTKWAQVSINRQIKEVSKVVIMFKDHLSGVINALITNFTNAMAERLNGKIQELKTAGRGYRTFEKFRSVILFFYGGLNLYPLK